jgi:hypothetical protein
MRTGASAKRTDELKAEPAVTFWSRRPGRSCRARPGDLYPID